MDNNLQHHGILGMKWGVRRYQNKDGSLTPRGKKRYDKEMEKLKEEEKILKRKKRVQEKFEKLDVKRKELDELKKSLDDKDESKKDSSTEKPSKKKTVSDLSNDELSAVIRRLELEKRYSDLQNGPDSDRIKAGRDIVKPVLTQSVKTLATDFLLNKGKKLLGLTDDDSLKKTVEKLDLEKRYRDLTDETKTEDNELRSKVQRLTLEKQLDALLKEKEKKS